MTAGAAELLKYYHNAFGALRVVFANEMYEMSKRMGIDYTKLKKGLLKTSGLPDQYLDVNENMRGYVSKCWDKDVPALIAMAKELGVDAPILNQIPVANSLYKGTKA